MLILSFLLVVAVDVVSLAISLELTLDFLLLLSLCDGTFLRLLLACLWQEGSHRQRHRRYVPDLDRRTCHRRIPLLKIEIESVHRHPSYCRCTLQYLRGWSGCRLLETQSLELCHCLVESDHTLKVLKMTEFSCLA